MGSSACVPYCPAVYPECTSVRSLSPQYNYMLSPFRSLNMGAVLETPNREYLPLMKGEECCS